MIRKHKESKPRTRRPEFVPNCPVCNKKNTVGLVTTCIVPSSHTKAFYCSDCLMEFKDNQIIEPLYA